MDRPIERLKRSITVENLWLYVLSFLSRRAPRGLHGYGIMKEIEKKFGIKMGLITPYIVLYRLEEDGYIVARSVGRRMIYTITAKGKKILKEGRAILRKTAASI